MHSLETDRRRFTWQPHETKLLQPEPCCPRERTPRFEALRVGNRRSI